MEPPPEPQWIYLFALNPITLGSIISFLVLLLLLLASGLVSGSEIAFFSFDQKRLEELKESDNRTHQLIFQLLQNPHSLLATILIANNFINIAIILLSTSLSSTLFDFEGSEFMAFIIQVIVITFLILLFGEVIPKVYASRNAGRLAGLMAFPIFLLSKIFYPLSALLVYSTNIINKRFKQRTESISVDELSHALELTSNEDSKEEETRILKGIVKFGNTEVKQIMTARVDVMSLDVNEPFETVRKQILDSGFSRIPVFEGNFDKVEGVLYIKDLLPHLGEKNLAWNQLLRQPFFVPENKKIDDLLKEFQEKKIHLAIVVDEYGGSSGVVSLEDIIEEIVGDIADEFDDDDITYSKLDDYNYIFQGKTLLKDFYRLMDLEGEEFEASKGEADTLAGFVIEIAGRIPEKADEVEFDNYLFTIEAADKRKIDTIKVTIQEVEEEAENDEKD
ncbi:gliding motility-associated protein GldE [bacterium SCSIO 12741]|nr:gliding motility-associated protein GldE [bacterium SCSIO 12741]